MLSTHVALLGSPVKYLASHEIDAKSRSLFLCFDKCGTDHVHVAFLPMLSFGVTPLLSGLLFVVPNSCISWVCR